MSVQRVGIRFRHANHLKGLVVVVAAVELGSPTGKGALVVHCGVWCRDCEHNVEGKRDLSRMWGGVRVRFKSTGNRRLGLERSRPGLP